MALPPRNAPHAEPDFAQLAGRLLDEQPALAHKLAVECGVAGEHAHARLREVLRFLALTRVASARGLGPLTPSEPVDAAWHELILCTRAYAALCAAHFGGFVHHDPGAPGSSHSAAFHRTLTLYAARYGPPPPEHWGPGAAALASADCGSCETGTTRRLSEPAATAQAPSPAAPSALPPR